jgi:predicted  nucleic acid-binding Zn-ribbon protein
LLKKLRGLNNETLAARESAAKEKNANLEDDLKNLRTEEQHLQSLRVARESMMEFLADVTATIDQEEGGPKAYIKDAEEGVAGSITFTISLGWKIK